MDRAVVEELLNLILNDAQVVGTSFHITSLSNIWTEDVWYEDGIWFL